MFLKMPSAEWSRANVAVTNTLQAETVSFTFILCSGRRKFLLQCKTAGGRCKTNFTPSPESERYGDSEHTLYTMEEEGGLIFSSLPSSPCLSSHLPDPASPQPAQQSERVRVAPTGDGGLEVEKRRKESQIKVLKIRGMGKAEGGGVAKKQ